MSDLIQFTVLGRPQQRGSKTPWLPRRADGSLVVKNGRPVIATMDSNKRSKAWMDCVRSAAAEAFGQRELLRGPIELTVVFYFSRPRSHFGTGRRACVLKDSAPHCHAQSPDLSKLMRALEDGITGAIWHDDRQVCRYGYCRREWTLEQQRAEVSVRELRPIAELFSASATWRGDARGKPFPFVS